MEYRDNNYKFPINYAIEFGNSQLVKLMLEQDLYLLKLNSVEIFYSIIEYQNEDTLNYFISSDLIDIKETNFVKTTLLLFGSKKNSSNVYEYTSKIGRAHV